MIVHHCSHCKEKKHYKEVSKYVNVNEDPKADYTLAYCESCNNPALFVSRHSDKTTGISDDGFNRIYPAGKRQIGNSLPATVKRSYDEAVRCEQHQIWLACIVMAAKTLEVVCNQYAPESTTILSGLEALLKKGILSEEMLLWSQRLRGLKSVGSLTSTIHANEHDATEIMDFLQSIMELMYHLRPKFYVDAASPARSAFR